MSLNIDPARWGKHVWKSLHYIAHAFPEQPSEQQKQAALQVMQSLAHLLPCAKCREHYAAYLAEAPPNVESREAFARYLNQLHNKVNARLDKEQVSYDPAVAYGKPSTNWLQIAIAIVIGIVIGYLLCKRL